MASAVYINAKNSITQKTPAASAESCNNGLPQAAGVFVFSALCECYF